MSYSIYIGNAIPVYPSEDNDYRFSWEVKQIENQDAPEWFCKPDKWGTTDISRKTNGRHPGYIQMSEFCNEAKVTDLFFKDEDCLIPEHPGVANLTELHCHKMTFARQKWEEKYPDARPGWNEDEDPILARLIWYEFWMKWTLENCEYPAVQNY